MDKFWGVKTSSEAAPQTLRLRLESYLLSAGRTT
jgi:hypothetical protein